MYHQSQPILRQEKAAVEHQLQEARKSHEIAESLPGDEVA